MWSSCTNKLGKVASPLDVCFRGGFRQVLLRGDTDFSQTEMYAQLLTRLSTGARPHPARQLGRWCSPDQPGVEPEGVVGADAAGSAGPLAGTAPGGEAEAANLKSGSGCPDPPRLARNREDEKRKHAKTQYGKFKCPTDIVRLKQTVPEGYPWSETFACLRTSSRISSEFPPRRRSSACRSCTSDTR